MSNFSQEDWKRISELYEKGESLPPRELSEWIDTQCNPEEKRRGIDTYVLKLLENAPRADDFFQGLEHNIEKDLNPFDESNPSYQPGDTFDKFRIIKEIGYGGMARVFLCERDDGQFEQKVALKIMKLEGNIEFLKEKFRQEQQILAGINYPNIAQLFDGGITESGYPYIIMEYVEGLPVDEYCKRNNLSLKEKLHLFIQVGKALQYAHNSLIVHHDIKPANILVNNDGVVKLLDFGISHVLFNQEKEMSRNTSFTGTIKYASPEQFRGKGPSVASDIYKLALVLFKLVTGADFNMREIPQESNNAGMQKFFYQKLAAYPMLKNEPDYILTDLAAVFSRALAENPDERFITVNALLHDLQNMLKNEPLHSRNSTLPYILQKSYLRNKAKFWLLVFFNIALFIAVGFFISQYFETLREKQRAEHILAFVWDMFDAVDPEVTQGDTLTVYELLETSVPRIDQLAEEPDLQAELYHISGRIFTRLGFWSRGEELYLKSLALHEELSRDMQQQINQARVVYDLASTARNNAEHNRADSLIDIALEVFKDNPGGETWFDYIEALTVKAHVMRMKGQHEASIEYAEEGLGLLSDSPQDYDQQLQKVSLLVNKASALRDMSHYNDALENMDKAMLLIDEMGDTINSTITTAYGNLGIIYSRLGKHEKALQTLEENYEMKMRIYGEKSPQPLITLNNIASEYYRKNNYAASDSINLILIERYSDIFGDHHSYTVSTMFNLANSYHSQGRFQEALEYQQMVLEKDLENFGEDHPYVGSSYYSIALTFLSLEDYTRARNFLEESLHIYRQNYGSTHEQISRIYAHMGEVECRKERYSKCIEYLEKAVDMAIEVLGDDHPLTLDYQERLNDRKQKTAGLGKDI